MKFMKFMISTLNSSTPKQSKLFFSIISLNAEEINILDLFSQYGKINDIELLKDKNGRSRGSGYIEFEDPSSNTKAIEALNGKLYKGAKLHLENAQSDLFVDNHEDQRREMLRLLEIERDKTKIDLQNNIPYFPESNLDDLPALPPPPPIYPMDHISSSRPISISAPPFFAQSDYQSIPQGNDKSNDRQKNNINNSNYSGSDYDNDYYNSDYYNSDYYYTNSESDEDQPKKAQNIPQLPQVISPLTQFQLNPHISDYEHKFSNLPPLNPPPPIPPLPPMISPIGAPNALMPSSSAGFINHYSPTSRNHVLPLHPSSILNTAPINDIKLSQQGGMISKGYDIQSDKDFNYGPPPSSIIQPHEHRRHHRSIHEKPSHRIHDEQYDPHIIDSTSIYHESDEQWVVMPPPKESPYWREKRAQVIDRLKKAAYEELRKNSNEKGKEKKVNK